MEAPNKAKTQEEEAARFLALRWELEYREAHTLSLDPNALGIIDPAEARRLEALPLQIGVDGPVFVVAEPSVERFAAVRALVGESASFVVVAQPTLEALMNSKVFNPGTKKPRLLDRRHRSDPEPAEAAAPPARIVEPAPPEPAPPEASAPEAVTTAPTEVRVAPEPPPREPVGARPVEAAPEPVQTPADRTDELEDRPEPARPAAAPPGPASPPRAAPAGDARVAPAGDAQAPPRRDDDTPKPMLVSVGTSADEPTELLDNLLTQIAASTGNLTAHVKELNEALQATQRELREAKEQLAEAQIESERHRGMIETLRDDLAKSRALTDATTSRLRDVVRALEAPTLGEALSSGPDPQQSGPIEARGRIA